MNFIEIKNLLGILNNEFNDVFFATSLHSITNTVTIECILLEDYNIVYRYKENLEYLSSDRCIQIVHLLYTRMKNFKRPLKMCGLEGIDESQINNTKD